MKAVLLVQLAIIVIMAPAYSQTPVADSTLTALQSAGSRNQVVRLFVRDSSLTGRLQDVRPDEIRLQRQTIAWHQIDSVQVRFVRNDPLWNGALIGAGVTALFARVVVQMFAGVGEGPLTGREKQEALFGGALLGAVIGMSIDGARVGPVSWRTVWHR